MAVNFVVKGTAGAQKSVSIKPGQPVTLGKGKLMVGGKVVGEIESVKVTPDHKPKFKSATPMQLAVDEMVQLDTKLKEMEAYPMLKRIDELKKQLSATAKALPADEPAIFHGTVGQVEFGACREETKVADKAAIVEKLTQAVFNEVANVTVTDLKKYFNETELAEMVMEGVLQQVYGSRVLKAVTPYDDGNPVTS